MSVSTDKISKLLCNEQDMLTVEKKVSAKKLIFRTAEYLHLQKKMYFVHLWEPGPRNGHDLMFIDTDYRSPLW